MTRLLSFISLVLTIATLICSCKDNSSTAQIDSEKQTETETDALVLSDDMLYIVAGGVARYGMVRASVMSNDTIEACNELYYAIRQKTGVKIPFIDDKRTLDSGMEEILIGNTSRKESAEAMKQLGDDHWSISVQNGKICIVAVSDAVLAKAIRVFAEKYISVGTELSNGSDLAVFKEISNKGRLTEDLHSIYVSEGAELQADAITKFAFNVSKFTQNGATLQWVQGGCSDGKYLYEFMISTDSKSCVIVKFDMETEQIVKKSSVLNLGHANDAEYNPHNNTIAVADCMSPDYNKVYVLDADKLIVLKTVELERSSAAQLTYNETTREYITANNAKIYFWNEDFELLRSFSVGLTKDHHTQGMMCDGEYIYRLEYWQNPNNSKDIRNNLRIIRVSDGKEMTVVELGIAREIEFVTVFGDVFYVGCNNSSWSGSEVYAFDLIPR